MLEFGYASFAFSTLVTLVFANNEPWPATSAAVRPEAFKKSLLFFVCRNINHRFFISSYFAIAIFSFAAMGESVFRPRFGYSTIATAGIVAFTTLCSPACNLNLYHCPKYYPFKVYHTDIIGQCKIDQQLAHRETFANARTVHDFNNTDDFCTLTFPSTLIC